MCPSTRQRAQAAVEFALVLPAFLLITAGTIEFGRAFFAYAQLLQAAQDGARYGAVLGNATDSTSIETRVRQAAPGGSADTVTVICSPRTTPGGGGAPCTRGNLLTVRAEHRQVMTIPIVPLPPLTQQASATMVIE